ncbi:MAG TPA: hypothetical protein VFF49_01265 [Thermodesulfobacteriota bacterium]|nr:hypothetical protein [Thermodesulfobacteriota bacterium]
MRKTVVYKIKRLIDGRVIGKEGLYVAVPDRNHKGHRIQVEYNGEYMIIPNWHAAEAFRRFHDLHGRAQDYLLGYFAWKPEGKVGTTQLADKAIEYRGNTAFIK